MEKGKLKKNIIETSITNVHHNGVTYFLNNFNISSITIHTIFFEIETMVDNEKRIIEWGMFLIRYVPDLIILINKLDKEDRLSGIDKARLITEALVYILVGRTVTKRDSIALESIIRYSAPQIIKLCFADPKSWKHAFV